MSNTLKSQVDAYRQKNYFENHVDFQSRRHAPRAALNYLTLGHDYIVTTGSYLEAMVTLGGSPDYEITPKIKYDFIPLPDKALRENPVFDVAIYNMDCYKPGFSPTHNEAEIVDLLNALHENDPSASFTFINHKLAVNTVKFPKPPLAFDPCVPPLAHDPYELASEYDLQNPGRTSLLLACYPNTLKKYKLPPFSRPPLKLSENDWDMIETAMVCFAVPEIRDSLFLYYDPPYDRQANRSKSKFFAFLWQAGKITEEQLYKESDVMLGKYHREILEEKKMLEARDEQKRTERSPGQVIDIFPPGFDNPPKVDSQSRFSFERWMHTLRPHG